VACAEEYNKLTLNWEDPYKVIDQVQRGTYRLETLDDTPIPRTWHNSNLQEYYQ